MHGKPRGLSPGCLVLVSVSPMGMNRMNPVVCRGGEPQKSHVSTPGFFLRCFGCTGTGGPSS